MTGNQMNNSPIKTKISHLLTDKKRFQQLTSDDFDVYGTPEIIELTPPKSNDPKCSKRIEKWIDWRAAPYPAKRHSEYLFLPDKDLTGDAPRILISAVLRPPQSIDDYLAQYSKKRRLTVSGRRAQNNGYYARSIKPNKEAKGIWDIIHSSDSRQGRGIAPMFADRSPDYEFSNYEQSNDANYQSICTGVFSDKDQLVAYLLGYRIGDHVQYDEIMGHHDHFQFGIMYFLHLNFLKQCLEQEIVPQCLNYGPWYSGADPYSPTKGLNYWKRRTGFKPAYLIAASY
jgi:hypothetical protein